MGLGIGKDKWCWTRKKFGALPSSFGRQNYSKYVAYFVKALTSRFNGYPFLCFYIDYGAVPCRNGNSLNITVRQNSAPPSHTDAY